MRGFFNFMEVLFRCIMDYNVVHIVMSKTFIHYVGVIVRMEWTVVMFGYLAVQMHHEGRTTCDNRQSKHFG